MSTTNAASIPGHQSLPNCYLKVDTTSSIMSFLTHSPFTRNSTTMDGWTASGTLAASAWIPDPDAAHSGCLRVEAVARGDTGANQIRAPLRSGLVAGQTATLRARVRWLRGHPEVLLRLRGNHLEAFSILPTSSGKWSASVWSKLRRPSCTSLVMATAVYSLLMLPI